MSAFMDSSYWSTLSIGGSLESSKHVDRAVDAVFEYLDDEILPTFEACSTHVGILGLELDDKGQPGYLVLSEMTLAMHWLVGDDMLERLHTAYRASDPTGMAMPRPTRRSRPYGDREATSVLLCSRTG
ncbi:hypothetical protein ACQQ2N_17900 [Dokdonella sp. MW10]|uniref:hypothetical protein n=1 Tax=Dokdonella sp. MW10 TaxID=2992926 RepID=UPI003F823E41